MIDWLKFEIPVSHDELNGGKLISIDVDGNEEWEINKRLSFEGSFESKIMLRSENHSDPNKWGEQEQDHFWSGKTATHLLIDGNPSKFLQGHNVDGIEDVNKLALLTYEDICKYHKQLYSDLTYQKIKKGEFTVYRIDINKMYDLQTDHNVEQWLHAAEMRAHGRSGRAQSSKGTVYLQKGSQLYSITFYNKHRELTKGGSKHKIKDLPFLEPVKEEIIEHAKGKLRVEVRVLAKQLKKMKLDKAKDLNENIDYLFNEIIGRCEMNANVELTNIELKDMPNKVIGTYKLWKDGHDVKEQIPHATYHRHKKILKEFNIDITVPPVDVNTSNVIPLLRVLEAKPAARPDWLNNYIVQ